MFNKLALLACVALALCGHAFPVKQEQVYPVGPYVEERQEATGHTHVIVQDLRRAAGNVDKRQVDQPVGPRQVDEGLIYGGIFVGERSEVTKRQEGHRHDWEGEVIWTEPKGREIHDEAFAKRQSAPADPTFDIHHGIIDARQASDRVHEA